MFCHLILVMLVSKKVVMSEGSSMVSVTLWTCATEWFDSIILLYIFFQCMAEKLCDFEPCNYEARDAVHSFVQDMNSISYESDISIISINSELCFACIGMGAVDLAEVVGYDTSGISLSLWRHQDIVDKQHKILESVIFFPRRKRTTHLIMSLFFLLPLKI